MIDKAAGFVPLALLFATALALSRAAVRVDAGPLLLGHVSRLAGDSPQRLLLGLLALTAGISALLPNAVTVLVMLPLLPQFIARFEVRAGHQRLFATAAAAAVMWAANIGGMATIIGSAANAILVIYLRAASVQGVERLNFVTWAIWGIPLSLTLTLIAWGVLCLGFRRTLAAARPLPHPELPAATGAQRRLLWLTAAYLAFWTVLSGLETVLADHVRAPIALAFSAWFLWRLARLGLTLAGGVSHLPWRGALLILAAIAVSYGLITGLGLDAWVGTFAAAVDDLAWPPLLVLAAVVLAVVLATEVMSNSVVALAVFPLIAAAAPALGTSPLVALILVSLGSTAPYMTALGAPSNALLVGEAGRLDLVRLALLGFVMNAVSALVLAGWGLWVMPPILG